MDGATDSHLERCQAPTCGHIKIAHGGRTGCILCSCSIPYNEVRTKKEKPQ